MQDILITPDNLMALIEQVSPSPSTLSPFFVLRDLMGAGKTPQRKDVILSPPVTPLIETLASPFGMGSLVYRGARIYMDTSVYIAPGKESPVVAVSSQQEKLRLQSPPPIEAIGMMFAEQIGNTLLDTLEISWKVSRQEAIVLTAILDAARKREFQRFLNDEIENVNDALPVSTVGEILRQPPKNEQWLTPDFRTSLGMESLTETDFQSALSGLSEKSMIRLSSQTLELSEEMQRALAGMLFVEGRFVLHAATQHEDAATYLQIKGVQGRVGAFLAWIHSENEVQFFSASAAGIVNLAEKMLLTPWNATGMDFSAPPGVDSQTSRDATIASGIKIPKTPPKAPERLQRK